MKKKVSLKAILSMIIQVTIGLIGISVAFLTVHRYTFIVQGVLGLSIWVFVYWLFISPGNKLAKIPLETFFEVPMVFRLSALVFIVSLIMTWAGQKVLEMVLFLLDLF